MRCVLAFALIALFAIPAEAGLFRKRCGKRQPVRNVVKAVVPGCPACQK